VCHHVERKFRDVGRLLTKFGNGGGFPQVGFAKRPGDEKVRMGFPIAPQSPPFCVRRNPQTQGIVERAPD